MLILLRQGRLSKWFSGIGQEAIAVGVAAALAAGRCDPADAPEPGRLHRPRPGPADAVPPAAGPRRRLHPRPRPHLPLRRPLAPHRRDDQPPRRDAAGGRRAGPRLSAARRAARGGDVHRRRRDERRRLPRSAEPGRGLEAARDLRHREQPVGPVDARRRAVRLRAAVRSRGRLRDGRRDRGRQRRAGGRRCGEPRGRPGAARRGTDAAGVRDVPHARPRGGLRHRLRAEAPVRGVGERRTRSRASSRG